jgi:hypothetical protein
LIEADAIRIRVVETGPSELAEMMSAAVGNKTVKVIDDVNADHITDPSLRFDTVALLRVQGTPKFTVSSYHGQ